MLAIVAMLSLGPGCAGPAAETRVRPKRSSLRMDDLPPPRRAPPPAVPLAPAHPELDLAEEQPRSTPLDRGGGGMTPSASGQHVVEKGETLYGIARAHGVSAAELANLNGVPTDRPLAVGQVLTVPAGRSPTEVSVSPGHLPAALSAAFEAFPAQSAAGEPRSTGGGQAARAARSPERPAPGGPAARVESSVLGALPSVPSLRSTSRPTLHWPLRGVLYARFGRKGKEQHDGIDLAAPAGTPVRTAGEGSVLFAGPQQGYGLLVIIEHARGLVTVYAHNRDLRVKTGQAVREGQVIATVGESGKTSGPHLHFEVRQDGEPVDPLRFLGAPPSA